MPAVLTVTDIAGLVKGAAEGAGLGNAFLSNIAAVDGIFHVCRAFAGDEIVHVEGRVDPVADLEIIHNELRLKDTATVSGQIESKRKGVERGLGGKEAKAEFTSLEKIHAWLISGKDIRMGDWLVLDVEVLNRLQLLTAKPVVYLVNLSEKDYIRKANKFLEPLANWVKALGQDDKILPFSVEFEAKIFDMEPEARDAYCKEKGGVKSIMPRIIKAGYHPPFWWFADIANSADYLTEAPGAIDNSSIANKTEQWEKNVYGGREIYLKKHGHYPNQPPFVSRADVILTITKLKSNGKK